MTVCIHAGEQRDSTPVNRSVILHMVERLEGLLGKLPAAIQAPVRRELNPLKELFLQQRAPRFLLAGSTRLPLPQLINVIFNGEPAHDTGMLFEIFRWQTLEVKHRDKIAVLDARGADEQAEAAVRAQLRREPADAVIVVSDSTDERSAAEHAAGNALTCVRWNDAGNSGAGVLAVHFRPSRGHDGEHSRSRDGAASQLRARTWGTFEFSGAIADAAADHSEAEQFISTLATKLPNCCRVEIVRSSNNRAAQHEIANVLIKSTSAMCAAIGAQPIPLADMPILTGLQLAMVSGIMYASGRERSMRAATEFLGALGANVGAGMLLREGARAMLKFFPGWGNLVCGMVAGAGTYAIGHAATAYFLEGVTLAEARRVYLQRRKKKQPGTPQLK